MERQTCRKISHGGTLHVVALAIDIRIVHAIHRSVCLAVPSATVVFVFWWVASFHPASILPWNSLMFGDCHPRDAAVAAGTQPRRSVAAYSDNL